MPTTATVGHSRNRNPERAGHEAASLAREQLGADPAVVLVFATAGYDPHRLVGAIAAELPGVPMVGCSAEGIIAGDRSDEGTHAVAVMAIASDQAWFATVCIPNIGADPLSAGEALASAALSTGRSDPQALLVFPDSLTADITALLGGLADHLPATVKIAGGGAGDMMRFKQTFQFHDGQVYSDAAVAVLIGGRIRLEQAVSHGCDPIGIERTVTRSDGRRLLELDHLPAWSVLRDYVDGDGSELRADDVAFLCFGQRIEPVPFYGDRLIRVPFGLEQDSGALLFSVEIPEGTHLTMTRRVPQRIVANAVDSATRLKTVWPGRTPALVLQLDCAGRGRSLFGERCDAMEVHPLQEVLGRDVPWVGCYTFGEIATLKSRPVFHQYTVVLCALYDLPPDVAP